MTRPPALDRTCRVGVSVALTGLMVGCVETLPIPDAYDRDEGLKLAELAVAAYDMRDALEAGDAWQPPAPYVMHQLLSTVQNWNDLGSEPDRVPVGWLGSEGEALYLVFRGTSTTTEALLDLNSAQVDYPLLSGDGGGTHKGFTARYEELHPMVLEAVEGLVGEQGFTRLVTTGHSLGGAVATMAAVSLAEQTDLTVSSYTFASPRVGDRDFVERYEALVSDTWRITNPRDVVPGYPEEAPFAPDSEFGQLFYEHVEVRVDVPFDDEDGRVERGLGLAGNHSACRYLLEVCELASDDGACATRVATHRSCD